MKTLKKSCLWLCLGIFIILGSLVLDYRVFQPILRWFHSAEIFPSDSSLIPSWPIYRGDQGLSGYVPHLYTPSWALTWTFSTLQGPIHATSVVAQNKVWIGSADGILYCLDLQKGQVIWQKSLQAPILASSLFIQDLVLVGNAKGVFYCLNANDGNVVWEYHSGAKIQGSANWFQGEKGQIQILVGSYDNAMHCLDLHTGALCWKYETENYIAGAPAIVQNLAIFGGCDSNLYILQLPQGKLLSQIPTESYIANSPTVDQNQVYLAHFANTVLNVDLTQFAIQWKYQTPKKSTSFFTSPALSPDRLVIGSKEGMLYCLQRQTGALVWKYAIQGEWNASALVCTNAVIAGGSDGRLCMLQLQDGKLLWIYEIGAAITSSPALAGDWLLIGAEDGRLYAFQQK